MNQQTHQSEVVQMARLVASLVANVRMHSSEAERTSAVPAVEVHLPVQEVMLSVQVRLARPEPGLRRTGSPGPHVADGALHGCSGR